MPSPQSCLPVGEGERGERGQVGHAMKSPLWDAAGLGRGFKGRHQVHASLPGGQAQAYSSAWSVWGSGRGPKGISLLRMQTWVE